MGVVVSLGHTDCTAEEARAALAEGARTFTHLFNAMSPLTHRAPGVAGAALGSEVPWGSSATASMWPTRSCPRLRARPSPDLTYLVSDAMPTVGGPTASGSTTWTCGSRTAAS
jgi:N-acetylglucosamine-6-phosphate deacetylase